MAGYTFKITADKAMRVKARGEYPWPCPALPNRTIELWPDDVLTKSPEHGDYMKHSGLGCCGIILTDDQVEPWGRDCDMQMMS